MADTEPAPPELVKHCEELARNISNQHRKFLVRPYMDSGGEYWDPEWRIKIIDDQNIVVVMHLVPEKCDWHTLHLMLAALTEHGQREFNRGKTEAVNKIAAHFKEIVK